MCGCFPRLRLLVLEFADGLRVELVLDCSDVVWMVYFVILVFFCCFVWTLVLWLGGLVGLWVVILLFDGSRAELLFWVWWVLFVYFFEVVWFYYCDCLFGICCLFVGLIFVCGVDCCLKCWV